MGTTNRPLDLDKFSRTKYDTHINVGGVDMRIGVVVLLGFILVSLVLLGADAFGFSLLPKGEYIRAP